MVDWCHCRSVTGARLQPSASQRGPQRHGVPGSYLGAGLQPGPDARHRPGNYSQHPAKPLCRPTRA